MGSSDLDSSQSLSGDRSWSIARRFFLTSFILIVAQSGLSLAISGKLWRDFTASHLNFALSRELLRPLNLVDNKLDSLTEISELTRYWEYQVSKYQVSKYQKSY